MKEIWVDFRFPSRLRCRPVPRFTYYTNPRLFQTFQQARKPIICLWTLNVDLSSSLDLKALGLPFSRSTFFRHQSPCHRSTESPVRQSPNCLYRFVPRCFVLLFISSCAFVLSLRPFATTGNYPMIIYENDLEFDSSTRASTIRLVWRPPVVFVHPFFSLYFFSRTRHSSTYRLHVIACRRIHLYHTLQP